MEFEDFCEFCKCYDKSVIREEKELSKNNSLYMYNEKYYKQFKNYYSNINIYDN